MTLQGKSGEGTPGEPGEEPIRQCAYCRRDASAEAGCTTDTITFPDGTVEAAIAYGAESTPRPAERCPGCGVEPNGYHHPFCPVEECPRCDGQLMRCGCLDTDCVSRRWLE
jgi:hypothetical protein